MKSVSPSKSLPRVWVVLFVSVLAISLILVFLTRPGLGPAMALVEDPSAGTLTVMDGERPVLTYRYGDQLPAALDAKQTRSSYIQPLYSLDGEVLTADFPSDHLHHHGLFWAWPFVEVRGVRTSNWEPAEPSLRQHFARWIRREADRKGARIVIENVWKLAERETVVEETVTFDVHRASSESRAIDVEIVLKPLGGPVGLRGAADANKGYGGFCFRGGPLFTGAAMTTDEGPLEADSTGKTFRWADLSTAQQGIAIFVSPDHPGYPVAWLIRNSYAGVLNPSWPGLPGTTLAADVPVILRYRVYIHRGDCASGRVKEAFEAYIRGRGL